jgi:predicted nucleic acid-binding protein
VPDDPDDDKFLAAALAGPADWLVTNDRHLLALDPHGTLRIVPSGRFVELVLGAGE